MAQEQLGKPLGEAYQALGLPGNPEDAAEVFYLHAEVARPKKRCISKSGERNCQ